MVKLSPPLPVKAKVTDVSAQRAWNTEYQNTTGRPLLVTVRQSFAITAVDNSAYLQGFVKATSPCDTPQNISGVGSIAVASGAWYVSVVIIVPHGYYYKVICMAINAVEGTKTWIETEL